MRKVRYSCGKPEFLNVVQEKRSAWNTYYVPDQQEVAAPYAEEAITDCDLMLKSNIVCFTFAYYSNMVE